MTLNPVHLGIAVAAMALLLGASTAAGFTHVESLEGVITFSDATATGKNTASTTDLGAVFVQAEHPVFPWQGDEKPGGVLGGQAGKALVNWSYMMEKGVSDPTSDHGLIVAEVEKYMGEQTAYEVEIAIAYQARQADILFIPKPNAQVSLTGQGEGEWSTRPITESAWWAGDLEWADTQDEHLTHRHGLENGAPAIEAEASVQWHIEGDVTLYVWGPNVTIREPDNEDQSFQSGTWRTDHVGDDLHPGGAAWDQHHQFLRIELTNANLTLNHESGPAMWTAQELTSQVNGSISYTAQRGFLQSKQFEYGFDDEIVTLEGDITQNVKKRQRGATEIRALVEGSASVDLPPSTERMTIQESRPLAGEPQAGDVAAQNSFDPRGGVWINTWLLLVVIAVSLVAMSRDSIKNQTMFRSKRWLISTSMDLAEENPKKGLRLAKRAVKKDKKDPATWNNYGIHMMDLGRYKAVVAKLAPAAEELKHPSLTYQVAAALAESGADDEEILKWLEKLVEQDPETKSFLPKDPHFKRLRGHPGLRRLTADPETHVDTPGYV